MYLFSRGVTLATGRTRESIAWAIAQTERVNKITGLRVGLFMQVWSPEVGSVRFSTFVPDLATLAAAGDKLNADDAFVSATDEGAALIIGRADDMLAQVVHGAPDPGREVEYVSAVRAVCANGNVARGMEVGIELAKRAEKITGVPSLFTTDVTGRYGGVGWVSGYDDVTALETAQQALASDGNWVSYVDNEVRGVFAEEPFLTTQTIYRRLA
jgi:hypothetical protein